MGHTNKKNPSLECTVGNNYISKKDSSFIVKFCTRIYRYDGFDYAVSIISGRHRTYSVLGRIVKALGCDYDGEDYDVW